MFILVSGFDPTGGLLGLFGCSSLVGVAFVIMGEEKLKVVVICESGGVNMSIG